MQQQRRVEELENKIKSKDKKKEKIINEIKKDKEKFVADKRYNSNIESIDRAAKREVLLEMKLNQRNADPAKQAQIEQNKLLQEERKKQALEKKRLQDAAARIKVEERVKKQ